MNLLAIPPHEIEVAEGRLLAEASRSPHWERVRREHLEIQPTCQVCGGDKDLNVHHIRPFHMSPELELDPANLITLCEAKDHGISCHQWFGHLGDWKLVNPSSVFDAGEWNKKFTEARA